MTSVHTLLTGQGWLIDPDALRAMAHDAEAFFERALPQSPASNNLLSVDDGIGVVSIEGPMMRKPDAFARAIFRATDSNLIGDALRQAGERDDIRAVFLDIDSPGGTVAGTPELAAAVKSINERKPVYAFSSGQMCSAAYWIASQARAIYVTPSAQVGSVGVVQAVMDNSAALQSRGIKVEVFAVGKYKTIGAPGTSLTDDQRSLIQNNLAEIARDFHGAVLARGRAIPAEAMEGQVFSGRQAQRFNLAGTISDRTEAMRRLRVFSGAVDTAARVMNDSPEDLLVQAQAQVATLQQENKAQADLLTEASTTTGNLQGQVSLLTADLETVRAERDSARTEITTLQTRVTELQASQADFDRKLQMEVARVVASTGTTQPARVTPAGESTQAAELHAQFAAITDPAAQTAFWRKLTPEQQALILKHQA